MEVVVVVVVFVTLFVCEKLNVLDDTCVKVGAELDSSVVSDFAHL